jgi:hypothetical protein
MLGITAELVWLPAATVVLREKIDEVPTARPTPLSVAVQFTVWLFMYHFDVSGGWQLTIGAV